MADEGGRQVFISYRQKDNKGNRWVSGFGDALKTELESTFTDESGILRDYDTYEQYKKEID